MVNTHGLELMLKEFLEQRLLPDSFLYICEQGKANWLALESSKQFPIASSLTELLHDNVGSIAMHARNASTLVSIGAGDAKKEFILLTELLKTTSLSCQVVDVSSQMVDRAMETLNSLAIDVHGIVGFCENMEMFAHYWEHPILLCLLGNNFCNYDPAKLLGQVSKNLNAKDLFLFDCHLFSGDQQDEELWRRDIEEIYNSPENAKFNIAPLVSRGMTPDSCCFELKLIKVNSPWGLIYRTSKQINIIKHAMVQCGSDTVAFSPGDIIQMGFTYKYRMDQLSAYLQKYNFDIVQSWLNPAGDNVILLVRKI